MRALYSTLVVFLSIDTILKLKLVKKEKKPNPSIPMTHSWHKMKF